MGRFSKVEVARFSQAPKRWAKAIMIVQSCISLGTVVVLAARAVNIL
jgi:hypothetical protein